ncbi:LytR/AlgR family response regulator transcription factor [Terrimonas pollutisoli]|uniref:LytR/AlgR family response regulator transcription factor n=1 Tax=Terrimonas pollutisoli TaxID=3034147 RepID=UPI0023ED8234|nr:response regulator [Terrimonas sp. H1YJ31]
MPGIKVMLVEDDWIIAKEISYSLQDLGFEVAGIFESGEESLKQVKQLQPDVVLMDIDLSGEINGIETAHRLKQLSPVPCIFLTALADHQTIEKAKLAEPYAYLVKPVKPELLYSTIEITLHNAARRNVEMSREATTIRENLSYDEAIFVKNKKRLEKVMLKDILWVEAYDIYAMIKTASGQYLLSHSLKVVEERFPSSHFIRVHRSYLVNREKIDAIEENDLVIANSAIPVGKTYRDALMKKLSFL